MKKHLSFLAGLVLLCACSKSHNQQNTNGSNVPAYYKDILINETLPNGNPAPQQEALGYFSLQSDAGTQLLVASRGRDRFESRGFRIVAINKSDGTVKW